MSVDGVSGSPTALHDAIAEHRCAGAQVNGCRAVTPVRVVVDRHGRRLTFEIRPRYSASEQTMLLGFLFTSGLKPVGAGQAASLSVDQLWYVTKATLSAFAHLFHPNKQQATLKRRRRLQGHPGLLRAEHDAGALGPGADLALPGDHQPVPVPAARRGPRVLGRRREGPGRKIPFSVERASAVGFVLIIIIFVIGLSNDISTLSGAGFNVH